MTYNYITINKATGSSTQIEHATDIALKKYRYDPVPDYIITDGSDMGASMAAANNYPTAKLITLCNVLDADYAGLSKRSNYVCASLRFAAALVQLPVDYHARQLVNLFQKIRDLNKAEYIMMMQERGVLYRKDRQVKMIPAIEVQKQDDGNSGAAFFGAYCYGIINGYDMDEVAKIANIAGALSLTKVGSITSIPTKEEVYQMSGLTEGQTPKTGDAPAPTVNPEEEITAPTANPAVETPTEDAKPAEQPAPAQPAAPGPVPVPNTTPAPSPEVIPATNPAPTPQPVPNPAPAPNQNVDAALQGIAGQPEMPKPANDQGTTNGNV